MTHSASRELLERLSLAAGAPGAENEVRAIVRESFEGVGEIRCDRLGSILCERRGGADSPRVVLDAHLDEVGFMVQSIAEDGRLAFVPLGGWWGHVLLGQRVSIVTDSGRIPGVIGSKPKHFLTAGEKNQVLPLEAMYIDVGAETRDETEGFGVRVGDTIVPDATFCEMANPEILSGKAFDDRAGVGVLCEALRGLSRRDHPNTIIGVGAVQEEVGCRGAHTASELARPDVAIVLEGTPADDLPGFVDRQGALGAGPQIRFYDPTAISNRKLVRFVEDVARECGITVQLAVRRSGGTNARSIHLHAAGVPTVVIGVPARYIHTHVALLHWQDYVATCRLVEEVAVRLDADTVAALTKY